MANYGKRTKPRRFKTSKADSGAQLFMSDEAKEQMLNRPRQGAEIEKLIDRALTERMLEGKITPKKSGRTQAYTYGDMIGRAIDDKPKVAKKKYGGKVAKMEAGGEAIQGSTMRALSDQEKKARKERKIAREKAKKRTQQRRDKQFLEDFKNSDKNDDMIRGNLIDKHADDTRSLNQYGADAQEGRSFGQKTRAAPYKKYRNGGMVEGYEYGGEVGGSCRGGGAAIRGTKFSGCK
jgi:hypothetical protein